VLPPLPKKHVMDEIEQFQKDEEEELAELKKE